MPANYINVEHWNAYTFDACFQSKWEVMSHPVSVTCQHCGAVFDPFGDYTDYEGPVPCIGCHKSTWISVDRNGTVLECKKWPAS